MSRSINFIIYLALFAIAIQIISANPRKTGLMASLLKSSVSNDDSSTESPVFNSGMLIDCFISLQNKKKLETFIEFTAQQLVGLLIEQRDYASLTKLLHFIKQKEEQEALARCLQLFKSHSICKGSAIFQIWQQVGKQHIQQQQQQQQQQRNNVESRR